jgi:hypothetical protein
MKNKIQNLICNSVNHLVHDSFLDSIRDSVWESFHNPDEIYYSLNRSILSTSIHHTVRDSIDGSVKSKYNE